MTHFGVIGRKQLIYNAKIVLSFRGDLASWMTFQGGRIEVNILVYQHPSDLKSICLIVLNSL